MSSDLQDLQHDFLQRQQSHPENALAANFELMSRIATTLKDLGGHMRLNNSLLQDIDAYFREGTPPDEAKDIFKIVPLYKQGFGPNWILNKENRLYCRVYALVSTSVDVFSPIGPMVSVTIPPITLPALWNPFDFPDQTYFYLDAGDTFNQSNIYVRLTNVSKIS